MCLRPVAAVQLEPPARLRLWAAVFERFFAWVWVAVAAILCSGVWTLLVVGMRQAPLHWHLMFLLGLVMAAIFVYVFALPYAQLRAAVVAQNWAAGGKALGRIRQLVGVNLILGFATVVVATLGRLLA
jgi:uncharacterized membrane protein